MVKGRAAARIREEMRAGTPDTAVRVATIKRADDVFARGKGCLASTIEDTVDRRRGTTSKAMIKREW